MPKRGRPAKEKATVEEEEQNDKLNEITEWHAQREAVKRLYDYVKETKYKIKAEIVLLTAVRDGIKTNGVEILTARYCKDGKPCTSSFNVWVDILLDPADGIREMLGIRKDMVMHSPVPEKLITREDNGKMPLETILADIYTYGRSPRSDAMYKEHQRMYRKITAASAFEGPVHLTWRFAELCEGDIFVYGGVHRTVPLDTPTLSLELSYVPVDFTTDTDELLNTIYRARSATPVDCLSSKTERRRDEVAYWTKQGGIPAIPQGDCIDVVLGKSSWIKFDDVHKLLVPRGVRHMVMKNGDARPRLDWASRHAHALKNMREHGYIAVKAGDFCELGAEQRLAQDVIDGFNNLLDGARKEFSSFFNWSIVEANGLSPTGDLYLDLLCPEDEIWKALSDDEMAKKHFGDERWMQRNGGTASAPLYMRTGRMVDPITGVGDATRLMRGPDTLRLSSHVFVVAVMELMFDCRRVFNCVDQFRLVPPVSKMTEGRSRPEFTMFSMNRMYKPFGIVTPIV